MKYKRVLVYGDSFAYGSDLSDCTDWGDQPSFVHSNGSALDIFDTTTHVCYSRSTWPALLAKHLNCEYVCHARPGFSNAAILRSILSTEQTQDDLVVISWSYIDRWEFFNIDREKWEPLLPNGTEDSKFFECYYKYIQSELWNKYESLKNAWMAHNIFKNSGIKFISTFVDSLIIDEQWHCPDYVKRLIDEISPELLNFDQKGFYQWAKDNKYPIGHNNHPLEDAHYAAFKHVINNYEFT